MNSDFSNLNSLCGQADTEVLNGFSRTCNAMKSCGYSGVYLSDIFVSVQPVDFSSSQEMTLFREDDALIVKRSTEHLAKVKETLNASSLIAPSCHFLQTLTPAGEKPQWIFDIHRQLLDMAAFVGVKAVTTHFAWMFGEQSFSFMGDYVQQVRNGTISREDYLIETVKRLGGRRKVLDDSYVIYEHLCKLAAE